MKLPRSTIILSVFIVLSIITTVSAHVPTFLEGGHSLEEAVEIEDPSKSWVIYSEIHEAAEPHYFYFEVEAGDRIRLILMIPIDHGAIGFRPVLVLMGPGLVDQGVPPDYLEVPENAGVMVLESETLLAEYEGFTPTAFYELTDVDLTAPASGSYYIAYYEPSMSGRFSIAIGYREVFSLEEWVLVPYNVITIHQWSGQNLATILAPILVTLIGGLALIVRKRKEPLTEQSLPSGIGILGGLLFLASGVFIFYQMIIALLQAPINPQVMITIVFGVIPILLGIQTIRILLTNGWEDDVRKRITLLIISAVALFTWTGWLIGSILVVLTGITPSITKKKANSTSSTDI